MRSFVGELVRRRVLRTAGLYLVAVWGVSQGAAELFPLFGASEDDVRLFIIAGLALLPIVVVLAWKYDITGQGVRRTAESVRSPRPVPPEAETTVSVSLSDLPAQRVQVQLRDGVRDEVAVQAREFVIGREYDCAVRFEDPAVSRHHARVFHRDGRWMIRDLGSTNGTWLDDARIQEAPLPQSCRIRVNEIGPTLQVSLVSIATGAAAEASAPAPDLGRVLVARVR